MCGSAAGARPATYHLSRVHNSRAPAAHCDAEFAQRETRVRGMVAQMDEEAFGRCPLAGGCATARPKGIPLSPPPG